MTDRARVVHVIPEDGIGGVEVAARTARDRDDLGCRVQLLFILNRDGGVRARHVKGLSNLSPRNLSDYRDAWRELRDGGGEVIVFSLWKSVPLMLAARLFLRRARLVYFLHLERPTHAVDGLFSWAAIRLADAVWADSEAAIAARRVPPAKRSRVISFVTERLSPASRAPLAARFVTWGRLSAQKGVDRAVELVALLRARGVEATFTAHGRDDGAGAALAAQAERLGVADRVRFPGLLARDGRAGEAAANSFFLQLSRFEGMCMAAVEAMQLGLVPVTTPVGQMRRYVRPGRTGVLVDPDDLPAAADALAALLERPDEYARLADGAQLHWADAPLYAEDVCRAALELLGRASSSHAPA